LKSLNIVKSKTQPPCSTATGIFPEECVAFLLETLRETYAHICTTLQRICCDLIDCRRGVLWPCSHHTFAFRAYSFSRNFYPKWLTNDGYNKLKEAINTCNSE